MKMIKISKLRSHLNKLKFLLREGTNKILFTQRHFRILFSPMPDWEPVIRAGFRFSRHKLTFAHLTDANIASADWIVPLTIPQIKAVQGNRSALSGNLLPIPSLEAVEICDDKFLFHSRLTELGFEEYLPDVGASLGFPYLLKKKIAEYGADIHLVTGIEQEKAFTHLLQDTNYFCQQIVQGRYEYATHLVLKEGKAACSLEIKYEFKEELPIKGNSVILNTSLSQCKHLDLITAILNGIGFEGLCCFNYKEIHGKPLIFEINPRFGGSLSPYFYSFVRKLA